jgi:hypothetical protein
MSTRKGYLELCKNLDESPFRRHTAVGRKVLMSDRGTVKYSLTLCFKKNMIFIFVLFFFSFFYLRVVHSSSFSTPHLKSSVERFRACTDTEDAQWNPRGNLLKTGWPEVQIVINMDKQREKFRFFAAY